MGRSILKDKSKSFALRIICLYKYLCEEKKEYVMSKQVLRSGTSIGANIAEAFFAQSDADFAAKLQISRKEAGETIYWIELLSESDYLDSKLADSLSKDCNELLKLLTASIITIRAKQSQKKIVDCPAN